MLQIIFIIKPCKLLLSDLSSNKAQFQHGMGEESLAGGRLLGDHSKNATFQILFCNTQSKTTTHYDGYPVNITCSVAIETCERAYKLHES